MDRAPAGAIYNVGGGAEASLRDAIEILQDEAGCTLNASFSGKAKGDVRRTLAATERIRSDLGWAPVTRLEAGLRRQARRTIAPRDGSTVAA
jgi:nucleoside-diphosphate-sugar epimerase